MRHRNDLAVLWGKNALTFKAKFLHYFIETPYVKLH